MTAHASHLSMHHATCTGNTSRLTHLCHYCKNDVTSYPERTPSFRIELMNPRYPIQSRRLPTCEKYVSFAALFAKGTQYIFASCSEQSRQRETIRSDGVRGTDGAYDVPRELHSCAFPEPPL